MDFNGLLNDTAHATRVLKQVERYQNVAIYETPIPQEDVAGNKQLRSQTRVPIAMHYGSPPIMTALREDVCDGFVIGGGASRVKAQGTVAATSDKPFFLELVGTGITATFSLHFASVLENARWPQVDCHRIFTHQMIKPAIHVKNGSAKTPEAPGLGVELDEDAVERFRIQPKPKPYPYPGLLLSIRWPDGATGYYAHADQNWDDVHHGRLPVFPRHVPGADPRKRLAGMEGTEGPRAKGRLHDRGQATIAYSCVDSRIRVR
jgi:galactonate dehydratase